MSRLIFELGSAGRRGAFLPKPIDDKPGNEIPKEMLRESLSLPDVSEVDVVRHFTRLSKLNYGVDLGIYPLGSCTMKYNPKVNEVVSGLAGFSMTHPLQPESSAQGCLELMHDLEEGLSEICGMDRFTLQPAAGAHGELAGLMIVKAYFQDRNEERTQVVLPDTSHGTNPASSAMCGFEAVEMKSDWRGCIDLDVLRDTVGQNTAVMMLTNPNTLGLFDENIHEIIEVVHDAGALAYCDGANMNAIMGLSRPGDMGFDIIQLNLHKTFSTPHGGGGPGSGPVGVREHLADFLPVPVIEKNGDRYSLDYDRPKSIGRIKAFYGNFGVMVKAHSYITGLGASGLRKASENAVLNANYLMARLRESYDLPYDRTCMHEFVLSGERQKALGVNTLDIAKRLLDYGVHAPTIYFPLIVREALMIEPTETESKESLDQFADIMLKIAEEAKTEPELVTGAPHNLAVSRLNDVKAAREPNLVYKDED